MLQRCHLKQWAFPKELKQTGICGCAFVNVKSNECHATFVRVNLWVENLSSSIRDSDSAHAQTVLVCHCGLKIDTRCWLRTAAKQWNGKRRMVRETSPVSLLDKLVWASAECSSVLWTPCYTYMDLWCKWEELLEVTWQTMCGMQTTACISFKAEIRYKGKIQTTLKVNSWWSVSVQWNHFSCGKRPSVPLGIALGLSSLLQCFEGQLKALPLVQLAFTCGSI